MITCPKGTICLSHVNFFGGAIVILLGLYLVNRDTYKKLHDQITDMKNDIEEKVLDIGTGQSNNLLDILSSLNIEVKDRRMGTMFERKDNKADINILTKLNWKPQIDLLNYLKENYDN